MHTIEAVSPLETQLLTPHCNQERSLGTRSNLLELHISYFSLFLKNQNSDETLFEFMISNFSGHLSCKVPCRQSAVATLFLMSSRSSINILIGWKPNHWKKPVAEMNSHGTIFSMIGSSSPCLDLNLEDAHFWRKIATLTVKIIVFSTKWVVLLSLPASVSALGWRREG